LTTVAIATIQKLQNFALQPMVISKHNSDHVKDNYLLFAPTPLLSSLGYSMVSFKFLPCRHMLPWQQILGQNWL